MAQHGGYREGAGRPKGSKNKCTQEVEEKIKALGCPFESMMRVAGKAEEGGDLATAGRVYSELARYIAPQRKAVDLRDDNAAQEPVGTREELRAMKEAILSGAYSGEKMRADHMDLIN